MPATSEKQKRFMDAAAHNPQFAKAAGVPVPVAKEFSEKSKGIKFGKDTNASRPDLQKINKSKTLHGKMSVMKGGGMAATELSKTKVIKSGKITPQQYARGEKSKGGDMKKMNMGGYADGGMPMVNKGGKMVPEFAADGKGKMAKGGMTSAKMGSVRTAAPSKDGVASKGKTKGTMIAMKGSTPMGMKKGGMAKKMMRGGKAC